MRKVNVKNEHECFRYHICVQEEGCSLQDQGCQEDWSQAVVEVDGPVVSLGLILSWQHSFFQQLMSFSNFVN